ncbi:CHAT domain-containing protein [Streptomyces sp. BK239]|uniref:CHAT domain-containing protein n=1 Tax=Streptomyces sp. BK239 TaxID=2512155 RepID=UPI00102CF7FD|nr:CHAT domain-containing protein [Streptomyces sp. BK239]RZU18006.1 CHAT domain-containing protein [Streptomyces sp. BK239]
MTTVAYSWDPRCEDEVRLRAFRASAHWANEDVEEAARQALEALLHDPGLSSDAFTNKLKWLLLSHAGLLERWDLFLEEPQQEHRSATPADPPLSPVTSTPRPTLDDLDGFDVVGDAALPSEDTAADRFLNLWLAWPLSQARVPADRCLGVGRRYELVMNIGESLAESLLSESGQPFPDDLLGPDGHWLTVSVCSDDFAVSPAHHHLFLPKEGDSWVCECSPDGPGHDCERDHRGPYLRVPVIAPTESGPARLRLLVAHRGHQLQSATLTATVAPRETRLEGAEPVSAEIDFTLTPGFAGIAALPPRTAAIRISQAGDRSLTVDVDGASGVVSTFRLGELQTAGALDQARTALMAAHVEVKDGKRVNLLPPDNRKSGEAFLTDLKNLAGIGWDLFVLIAPRSAQRQALRDVLGGAGQVQICRQEGLDLTFPWALVYDIPVVRGSRWVHCKQGLDTDLPLGTRECPGADGHQLNTLCPFGFWGYRHIIEQPPSRSEGQRLALVAGSGEGDPAMTVALSTALDFDETERHVTDLHRRFGGRLTDHTARDTLFDALVDAPDCLYFYCHGREPEKGRAPGHSVLEIGKSDWIGPQDLAALDTHWASWRDASPLVFLNGCHTVDSGPATWHSYADAFTDLHASGVVGTEISVAQTLASEVAELFWQSLLDGRSVGSALHSARAALLKKNNLLGLAYTAYCSGSLTLRPTAAAG